MRKNNRLLITLISLLVVLVSVTISYYSNNVKVKEELILTFDESKSYVSSTDITPGWSLSKNFAVENNGNKQLEYNIIFDNLVNTFVSEGNLVYRITSTTGGYNMGEFKAVPKANGNNVEITINVNIPPKSKHQYKIEFKYIEANDINNDINKIFSGTIAITSVQKAGTFISKLLADNPTILTRTNFTSYFTSDNTGTLYTTTATEDGSTVYYFAGNALNNWVKFGKDKDGKDLYWRIIRTNEDGSIRLLYLGEDQETESALIASSSYYNNWDEESSLDPMYVGYMYGTSENLLNNRTNQVNSSEIKRIVDNWYASSLNVKTDGIYTYDKYVSKTAIYCNDRSTNGTYSMTNAFNFAGLNETNPSYKCGADANRILFSDASDADKFSVSTAKGGNGLLTYPVALMTANELQFAGIADWGDPGPWYVRNITEEEQDFNAFYTMTPGNVEEYDSNILMPSVYTSGEYGNGGYSPTATYLTEEFGVRPVISIKSCANWVRGNGSPDTPYEFSIDATCAASEN